MKYLLGLDFCISVDIDDIEFDIDSLPCNIIDRLYTNVDIVDVDEIDIDIDSLLCNIIDRLYIYVDIVDINDIDIDMESRSFTLGFLYLSISTSIST